MIAISLAASGTATAQLCGQTPDMLIAFDRSWSMTETVGSKTKWSIATAAVSQLVTSYAGQIRFGLMLYPSKDDSCQAGTCVAGAQRRMPHSGQRLQNRRVQDRNRQWESAPVSTRVSLRM